MRHKKEAAHVMGQNGGVCVQLSHYASNLLTRCSTEAIIFSFVLTEAAAECAVNGAAERGSDERALPSSASHPFSVKFCVRLIWHQASSLVSAPAALCVECLFVFCPSRF